jgi:hypothetical protein
VTGASANGRAATFDLEAAAAAGAEAEAVPFAFTYKGKSYEVPPSRSWPVSALRKVARGDLEDALAELLGAGAFDQLCDAGLNVGELNVLFEGVAKAQGLVNLPNSRAPQRRASTRR